MSSARRSTRRLFRKLSWAVGCLFAFVGGVFALGLFLNQSEGQAESFLSHTSFVGVIAWLVITTALFILGWIVTRGIGFAVLSVMPRSDHVDHGRYDDEIYEDTNIDKKPNPADTPVPKAKDKAPAPAEPPAVTAPAQFNQMSTPGSRPQYNRNKDRRMRKGRAKTGLSS